MTRADSAGRGNRAERVFRRPHDGADAIVFRGIRNEPGHVVGRRDIVGIEARRIGVRRVVQAEVVGLLVHSGDEAVVAQRREAGQRARRGVVRRNQQQVQQVRQAHAIVGAQIGRRRAQRVRAHNLDFLVQVGRGLEEDNRGHHFGDAGDRALVLGILFVEHLAGRRVVDDGGGRPDFGDDVAGIVGAIPGRLRLGQGLCRPAARARAARMRAARARARAVADGFLAGAAAAAPASGAAWATGVGMVVAPAPVAKRLTPSHRTVRRVTPRKVL